MKVFYNESGKEIRVTNPNAGTTWYEPLWNRFARSYGLVRICGRKMG